MASFGFVFGLTIGTSFFLWQHYRFRKQLKKIVNSVSTESDKDISLPPLSLMRRELNYLESQRQVLEEEKNSWRTIVEQAPVGYLQVDRENQLRWCNKEARILLKIDRWREGEVRLLLELIRSYELDCLVEKTRRLQTSQEQEWIFYVTRHANAAEANRVNIESVESPGQYSRTVEAIAVKGYAFPRPNQEIGVFIVNRQPLVELSASRDRAVSDLFHELKTPLTSISLVAETLVKRLENPERRWVEQMLNETNRLTTLVTEWLDLAQLEANPHSYLKYEEIDVLELINSVWQTLEPIADREQIVLELKGNNPSSFSADKSRLTQVFLNLLDNAIKHSPQQSKILVEIKQQSSASDLGKTQLVIDIIDSGTGFNPSDIPYVFDRLYRGDKSRTRQFVPATSAPEGSGLGLAIVQQIIQAHQGFVEAKNHSYLGGAWLQITLPLAKITNN